MKSTFASAIVCAVALGACGSSTPSTPAVTDSGTPTDTGVSADTGTGTDAAGQPPTDGGVPVDASSPRDGGTGTDTGPAGDTGPAADWSCLGHTATPVPAAMTTITWRVLDFVTMHPIMGVTVKVCTHADPTCMTPVTMATTDAMGNAMLTFSRALPFDGIIDMTGGGVYPSRVFGAPTTDGGMTSIQVLTPSEATLLSTIAGADLSPTRGQVIVDVHDCMGTNAAGASVAVSTADSMSQRLYIRAALPDTTVMDTDATGIGGFVNVPTGPATVTATVAATHATVGTYTIDVRAGYLQTVIAQPGM